MDRWRTEAAASRRESDLSSSLIAGLVSAIVSLGLQGIDVLGADVAQLVEWNTWQAGLTTSYAVTLAVAVAALLIALLSGRVRGVAGRRTISAVAVLGVGVALR